MRFSLQTTKVTNSRFFKRQNTVWRRRQTVSGSVFTTRETVDLTKLTILKKASPTEHYRPGKLFLSLHKACDHIKDADDVAWQLLTTVEEKLIAVLDDDFSLPASQLAEISMETLKLFNTTAYVKYASYQPELVSARSLSTTLK